MLINYQALPLHLKKSMKAIYVLVGSDPYLLNDATINIKKAWRQLGETDEKIISVATTNDWGILLEEAYSYSLFAENVLLDIRYDKKSIDAAGKTILNQYLLNINSRCLIILQANAVPAKQLQWLADNEQVMVIQVSPLSSTALQNWIATQLKTRSIRHAEQIPALIQHYAQNNMLACAQIVEKLALVSDASTELTVEEVSAHLIDQSEFQLYELADACLSANTEKALHLLRQACHSRVEPTLILWLLTQEIRQLIQLSHLLKQQTPLSKACSQLKIWPKREKLYEKTVARLSLLKLYQLLHDCKQLDESIKTSQNIPVWHGFEKLALALSKCS